MRSPLASKGIEIGRAEGVEIGVQQGVELGELKLLRRQVEARFGPIPDWADTRITGCSAAELEDLGVRLLGAKSLEQLPG